MYAGKIVEYGLVKVVMQKPLHPYTQGLLNAIPRIKPEDRLRSLDTIKGYVPNLISIPIGCRFNPRCAHAMKICLQKEPPLLLQPSGVKTACFLYDNSEEKKKYPELYEKINIEM
jgi:peptide/nickel transport system ATP-binding protein